MLQNLPCTQAEGLKTSSLKRMYSLSLEAGRKGRTISSGRPNQTQGKSIWMPSPPVVFSRGKTGLDAEALPKQATTALEADVGHKGIQTPGTLIGQGLAGGLIGDAVYWCLLCVPLGWFGTAPKYIQMVDHWGLFCGSHITRIENSLVNLNYLAPVIWMKVTPPAIFAALRVEEIYGLMHLDSYYVSPGHHDQSPAIQQMLLTCFASVAPALQTLQMLLSKKGPENEELLWAVPWRIITPRLNVTMTLGECMIQLPEIHPLGHLEGSPPNKHMTWDGFKKRDWPMETKWKRMTFPWSSVSLAGAHKSLLRIAWTWTEQIASQCLRNSLH